MSNLLEEVGDLIAPLSALLVDLVADAPHHDGGGVSVVTDEVDEVALRPVVKEGTVSILHLRDPPLVEALRHDQHPHLVCQLDQLRGGHIVRGADGIDAHILHLLDLSADGDLIHRCSEWPEVVVEADALEGHRLAIEVKALVGTKLYRPHTEGGAVGIDHPAIVEQFALGGVEVRLLDVPEVGMWDAEVLLKGIVEDLSSADLPAVDRLSLVENGGAKRQRVAIGGDALQFGADLDLCVLIANKGSGDKGSPVVDPGLRGRHYQVHITVQTSPRVPAREVGRVVEPDGDHLSGLGGIQVGRDVEVVRVVPIGPSTDAVTIDVHLRVAHCPVDVEGDVANGGGILMEVKVIAVPAHADEG